MNDQVIGVLILLFILCTITMVSCGTSTTNNESTPQNSSTIVLYDYNEPVTWDDNDTDGDYNGYEVKGAVSSVCAGQAYWENIRNETEYCQSLD